MYEIIRKNKIKSIIALIVVVIWYVFLYGSIIGYLIMFIKGLSVSNPQNSSFEQYLGIQNTFGILLDKNFYSKSYFIIGALISLIIFCILFIFSSKKPYKEDMYELYEVNNNFGIQLKNVVEEIAIASGLSTTPKTYILNSDTQNAYACGLNPNKASIVVTKGLLEVLSRDELQGVIAHEMSHIINRDTTYLLCSGIIYNISSVITRILKKYLRTLNRLLAEFREPYVDKLIGFFSIMAFAIIFPVILLSFLAKLVCTILLSIVSQSREYMADAYAVQYTRYPKGLAYALSKIENSIIRYCALREIVEINKNTKTKNKLLNMSYIAPALDNGYSTHPPTRNRIQILLNMTRADYLEYEKEFERLNNKKLLPKSVLDNSKKIEIKHTDETKLGNVVVAACALDSMVLENEIPIIKENKEILNQNIQKHRKVEDLVRNLADYTTINCECETKLKIPPVYKNTVIICPHCKKKHTVIKHCCR